MSADLSPKPLSAGEISFRTSQLVNGDRARQHGDFEATYARVATLWNAWLQIRENRGALTAHDVVMMLGLMKDARTQSGNYNVDDYIDSAGYRAGAGEIAERSK